MKAFVFDSAKCNGCHNCQVACKDEHVGNEWAPYAKPQPDTGQFWCKIDETVHGQVPKVRVEYKLRMSGHGDALLEAAPECTYRTDEGFVIIDPEKSKGRKDLAEKFPGEVFWNEELQIPQKCTGCQHLVEIGEMPHCVDMCPTGALSFGEMDELDLDDAVQADEGGIFFYRNLPGLFIGGEVYDPAQDEIIEGAKAVLIGPDGKTEETQTDYFGDFWFEKLEPGAYSLNVEANGYESYETTIELEKSLNVGAIALSTK